MDAEDIARILGQDDLSELETVVQRLYSRHGATQDGRDALIETLLLLVGSVLGRVIAGRFSNQPAQRLRIGQGGRMAKNSRLCSRMTSKGLRDCNRLRRSPSSSRIWGSDPHSTLFPRASTTRLERFGKNCSPQGSRLASTT